jgi:hypothetical protein
MLGWTMMAGLRPWTALLSKTKPSATLYQSTSLSLGLPIKLIGIFLGKSY